MTQKLFFKAFIACVLVTNLGTPAEARPALTRRNHQPRTPRVPSKQPINAKQNGVPTTSVPEKQPTPLSATRPISNQALPTTSLQPKPNTQTLGEKPAGTNQLMPNAPKETLHAEGFLAAAWDGMRSKVALLPWIIATGIAQKGLHMLTHRAHQAIAQEPSLKRSLQGLVLKTFEGALVTSAVSTLATKLLSPEENMPSTPSIFWHTFTRTLGYHPELNNNSVAAIRNAIIRTVSNIAISSVIPN